jgi:hypothetical protein
MEVLFSLILVGIVAIVTWCVASEGVFGAGLTFLCVLFAGLLATNFFEPVANMIDGGAGSITRDYADVVALLGLFIALTFVGRLATDNIAPTEIEYDARVYQAGRWLFALATGYTTMAILLTAVHTAPLPRNFLGFAPERKNLFDICAPDRQWLGLVQHVSENVLATGRIFDGSQAKVPETTQTVWPSFAIRYATKRQDYASPPKPGVTVPGSPAPTGIPPAASPGGGPRQPPASF